MFKLCVGKGMEGRVDLLRELLDLLFEHVDFLFLPSTTITSALSVFLQTEPGRTFSVLQNQEKTLFFPSSTFYSLPEMKKETHIFSRSSISLFLFRFSLLSESPLPSGVGEHWWLSGVVDMVFFTGALRFSGMCCLLSSSEKKCFRFWQ
jgi:hypothetical protein